MADIEIMRIYIENLNYYTQMYNEGHPIVSDALWDETYFNLKKIEEKTGIIYPDSPTQKIHYDFVSALEKIEHEHPMLSLDKSKDLDDIKAFIGNQDWIAMFKLDGLTCSLTYENGKLVRAETRGNGLVGENILHNAKVIKNIPQAIPYTDRLVVDGEIICTYDDFTEFANDYKNPRNFASGSIRLLDSKECAKRKLSFIVWEMIEGYLEINQFWERLEKLQNLGFDVVPFVADAETMEDAIKTLKNLLVYSLYPTDGFVFKFNDVQYGNAQGQTDHHLKNAIALKLYDELYDTKLYNIEWTMGRTGVLTPVARFQPIEIDGTTIERASLHNVSVMKNLFPQGAYFGNPIKVFKANQIIPQIAEVDLNYSKWDAYEDYDSNDEEYLPYDYTEITTCPICHSPVELKTSNDGVINAFCSNPNCEGKLINRLDHFCGKKGLDIKGLSKATFEKLILWGWIDNLIDVFSLKNHRLEWINKSGFGEASVDKILKAIEESKNTTLDKFIAAIGIPLIGQVAAKELGRIFTTYENFRAAIDDPEYHFFHLDNFGDEMEYKIKHFNYKEADKIATLLYFNSPIALNNTNTSLKNQNIVITGKLQIFKNRTELQDKIKTCGGKVGSSVTSKTTLLINNDINSTSSKNQAAKQYGIPIITEADFVAQYLET